VPGVRRVYNLNRRNTAMETSLLKDVRYKRRLFVRYFGVTLIPVVFFLITGTLSVVLAQRSVSRELVSLNLRSLHQVKDAFEIILSETNSLALSLSTDPEFYLSAEKILTSSLVTVDDLKRQRWLTSGINSAVNTRQYLQSLYVSVNTQPQRLITTTESVIDMASFADADWLLPALGKKDEIGFWVAYRPLRLLSSMPLTVPTLTLYRNMLGASSFENKGIIAVNLKLEYIQGILDSLKDSGTRKFAIFDSARRPIVKSRDFEPAPVAGDIAQISLGGVPYVATSLASEKFPFTYCSYAPAAEVYRLSDTLLKLSVLFASLSLVAGLLVMYAMARRSFRAIESIVDIIQAAEHGSNLPQPVLSGRNSFSSLTYSILQTFVEHKYMKLRQVNLELLALQSQMNPHFLFNTLTTISCMALELTGSPNRMTAMIERLARILAYSLENPRAGVKLSDEIAYTRDYLEIQRIRSHDRFRAEWDIGAETEGCRVIKLLLQPLVENAINHGIGHEREPNNTPGAAARGVIRIRANRLDGQLRISVQDDGAGIPPAHLDAIRCRLAEEGEPDGHIGLFNTAKRLRLFFAGEATVDVTSAPGRGTVVQLVMPAADA
jgi:two-component system, sensor histidine kinase YesM